MKYAKTGNMDEYFKRNLGSWFQELKKEVFRKDYVAYTYIETSFQVPQTVTVISLYKSIRNYQER